MLGVGGGLNILIFADKVVILSDTVENQSNLAEIFIKEQIRKDYRQLKEIERSFLETATNISNRRIKE